MSEIPFVLSLDTPTFYGHDTFPNGVYRRLHARHHHPLDLPTLGLIARLGAAGQSMENRKIGGYPSMNRDKNGFEVHLDVGLFHPNEVSVKVLNDCVVIEAKHEEREDDYGFISRQFTRRYELPKGSNMDDVEATLTSDGVLTVRVPEPIAKEKPNERIIEIKHVGPSDLFLKNKTRSVHNKESASEEQEEESNE